MRYFFVQKTGMMYDGEGKWLCTGYSGFGQGRNNPTLQNVPDVGPLPRGVYTIGSAENGTQLGPDALPLMPDAANEMFGRSGFFVHGDSLSHPGCASHGCIIAMPWVRAQMKPGDTVNVVETYADLPAQPEVAAAA